MRSPAVTASFREETVPHLPGPTNTLRVLIRVGEASEFVPTAARLTFTTGSGEPVSEVALDWTGACCEEAGLRAILDALRIAKRYRARRVVIYIDNETAASVAAGREKAPAALVGLALQLRALSHTYASVEVRHGVSSVAPTLPELWRFAAPSTKDRAPTA